MFKSLQLERWRQFQNVNIELDQRLTVLTGENGTGKTTILNLLSRHFGWNLQLITAPLPVSEKREKQIWSDAWQMLDAQTATPDSVEVGSIQYSAGGECKLMIPPNVASARYTLTYQSQQSILGLHIPSHRPAFAYHQITSIPTDPKTSEQQYQQYQNLLLQLYQSESSTNPVAMLKQSLVALAVFGFGNEAVSANDDYRKMFDGFQDILRILLPKNLGFQRLHIRMPEIVFTTTSGDFSLDAASGGVAALVGIAWQIFMYGQDKGPFVVTIDEPESHLHPSMQREILPNLFEAFPQTQFVVATHSPFVVTSSPHAKVYALTYDESRRVKSVFLDTADLSGTANETLRQILGVPISVPIWVEDQFQEIVDKYRAHELSIEKLRELRAELIAKNLGAFVPEAVSRLGSSDA